jgi:hypothetical protein
MSLRACVVSHRVKGGVNGREIGNHFIIILRSVNVASTMSTGSSKARVHDEKRTISCALDGMANVGI